MNGPGPERRRSRQYYILILLLISLPLLGGAKCAFWFSSGDSDRDDKPPPEEPEETAQQGSVGDTAIAGLWYESGSLSGVTGPTGNFQYESGKTVRLFLGDVPLGEPVPGKKLIAPPDLVPGADYDSPAVINITRLLLSLDSVKGDETITIPATVRSAARLENDLVAASIEYLDFTDESAFVNAASQLVAALTDDYPFTASLVDAETAREYLRKAYQKRIVEEGRR